ncbi:hypothetical protein GMA12_10395 [Kocuria sediminis]|uniref:NAD-dependent epimerase/dehydratase family protein n=1 Tax=Kocuria sediminis TaxID=1038857 RepID=A0A6N8GKW3_9MICC|nr:hypothetical protein [Kocuria sediminis]MUN63548.1 hypothetical protein [Kocuria sediminis]
MRVLVLGGTSFIGRAVVVRLLRRGDRVAVYHWGRAEPPELAAATHLHGDRADLPARRDATVLRLPMVYGPHDPQCREDFVLRRAAAGGGTGSPWARAISCGAEPPSRTSPRQWSEHWAHHGRGAAA